jgi:uncharacterized protein YndB with AHSA1/START domain
MPKRPKAESRFLYVTYIRATPERIFDALTDPEQNKLFWSGYSQRTSWKPGDRYEIADKDGKAWDQGNVLVCDPPRRISVTWTHLVREDLRGEGESVASFELEPAANGVTKVKLTHSIAVSPSKFIEAVSGGWPSILSSLKSLLETGKALETA